MNYVVALIVAIGLFWGGYFFFSQPESNNITPEVLPVEYCYLTDDGFMICKLKEN